MTATSQDSAAGAEENAAGLGALRERILQSPESVLEDSELMAALLGSQEKDDRRVVDLRAAQLIRLEERLRQLRQTHRDVIEAALESMNGVEQAHQAALLLMETDSAESLAGKVRARLPLLLPVEEARLCLCLDEPAVSAARKPPASAAPSPAASGVQRWLGGVLQRLHSAFALAEEPEADLLGCDRDPLDPALVLLPADVILSRCPKPKRRGPEHRRRAATIPGKPVAISVRDVEPADRMLFGVAVERLEGVAAISLDLAPGRDVGALVFGVAEKEALRSSHLIEQLAFIGGVVERLIRSEDMLDSRLLNVGRPAYGAPRLIPGGAPEARP